MTDDFFARRLCFAKLQLMREKWKPIPDYETHYAVSDLGRVRRIGPDSYGRCRNTVLRFGTRRGYANVTLCVLNQRRTFSVHRVVWEAFIGTIPPDQQINHKNGVKDDNRLANLEVVSASENKLHSIHILGKRPTTASKNRGRNNARSKVTFRQAEEIRRRYAQGETSQQGLADIYGIDQTSISRIILKQSWLTPD